MANTPSCAACKYFYTGPRVFTELQKMRYQSASTQPGYCTLNAPVINPAGPRWPITSQDESCGQFVAKGS
jgi:hypothetical protein